MIKTGADYLKIGLIIFFSITIVVYFVFNFRVFIAGPEIIITSPENGAVVDNSLIEISGRALNTSFISLNNRPILVDKDGYFKEFLLLSGGYNIIVFEAKDKFDRHISKKLELTLNKEVTNHQDLIDKQKELSEENATSTTPEEEVEESAGEPE